MKLSITQPGVFDVDGNELPIGGTIDVPGDEVPAYLINKVLQPGNRAFVTNPAEAVELTENTVKGSFTIGEGMSGWYPVLDADGNPVKKLRKDDAEAFKSLSDEDKLAYLSE